MTDIDLGWTAGIIDGEGTIGIYPSNRGLLRLAVQVGTTSEVTARKLQSLWGGGVSSHHKDSNRKRVWVWGKATRAASVFLKTIRKCLVEKKTQAEVAISFAETIGSRGCQDKRRVSLAIKKRRATLAEELKGLKHV